MKLVAGALALAVSAIALQSTSLAQSTTRLYMIGNSLTDGLLWGKYDQAFAAKGKPVTRGVHLIWGTPMDWMWDHGQPHDHNNDGVISPTDSEENYGSASKSEAFNNISGMDRFWKVLPNQQLDVLSLQAFDRKVPSDYIGVSEFLGVLKKNPANLDANGKIKTRVVLFTQWPSRTAITKDVTPADGVNNPVTVGFQGFNLSQKWLDVNNTGNSEDDYKGTGWDELTGNKTRDYSIELIRKLRDPNAVGKKDGGTSSTTGTITLPASVTWGLNRASTLTPEVPANIMASPIRLIPVADTFVEFETRLRAEAAATSIAAVEAKYGLTNTAEDPDRGALDPTVYNNLGDMNFAEHLFGDGIHVNALGHYLQMTATYAVMFDANPAGMPAPEMSSPNPEFLSLAQDISWDIVHRDREYTLVPEPTLGLLVLSLGLPALAIRRRQPKF